MISMKNKTDTTTVFLRELQVCTYNIHIKKTELPRVCYSEGIVHLLSQNILYTHSL